MKIRERLARLIYAEHCGPHSEPYDQLPGHCLYDEHTVDARLSADAIQNSFFMIPKPSFLRRGRYGLR